MDKHHSNKFWYLKILLLGLLAVDKQLVFILGLSKDPGRAPGFETNFCSDQTIITTSGDGLKRRILVFLAPPPPAIGSSEICKVDKGHEIKSINPYWS